MNHNTFITDISAQSLNISTKRADNSTIKDIEQFKCEWFSKDECIEACTSGSTGTPSKLLLNKKHMMNSAIMTLSYLKIPEKASVLLCMPLKFIGAKMILVRALVGNLRVIAVTPSSHPLTDLTEPPYFAAMTPAQVASSLDDKKQADLLKRIDTLIIGGGPVNLDLFEKIKNFKNNIYSTYGMTETMSHIALKKLTNGFENEYHPFCGVELTCDENNCLIIRCKNLGISSLKTKDIVDFNEDGSFIVRGRLDNTVNTGGIKIQIEAIEEKLSQALDFDFNISSVDDPVLGEKIVILANKKISLDELKEYKNILPKYWAPKESFYTENLPKTQSGKPARSLIKSLVNQLKNEKNSK